MFKLTQVLHCPTNQLVEVEDNVYCFPDDEPGFLLGLVKVMFCAIPSIRDEYKNDILIDIGLSKYLSLPIELKVVTPKLYKFNKYLHSEKLFFKKESIFKDTKVEIKELHSSPISLEDTQLIKKFREGLKQAELYSDNCVEILESTDQNYYKKLCMLLYLEGDHRRCLIQRYMC